MSCILESLSNGDDQLILERSTIGSDDSPQIELTLDGEQVEFTDGSWETEKPSIHVFNSNFVERNVYSGKRLSHDHKKNLHQLVIGDASVQLSTAIGEFQDIIRGLRNQVIDPLESEIENSIESDLSIDEYIELTEIDDIDERLDEVEQDIASAQKADRIQENRSLQEAHLPTLPRSDIEGVLTEDLEDVQAEARREVSDHIDQHLDDGGENWIQEGQSHLEDGGPCPFCGQNLEGVDLVDHYEDYFSDAYEDLKDRAEGKMEAILDEYGAGLSDSLEQTRSQNEDRFEFWRDFVDEEELPSLDSVGIASQANPLAIELADLLAEKVEAPLEELSPPDRDGPLSISYEAARQDVQAYNTQIASINEEIAAEKRGVQDRDTEELEGELEELQDNKARFGLNEDAVQALESHREVLSSLQNQKSDVQDRSEERAEELLRESKDAINRRLEKFQADFRLDQVEETHQGDTPGFSFRLDFVDLDGDPINPTPRDTGEPKPSFESTLSSGDRRTLAFAVFLSKLDRIDDLGDHIVVFDDPFSSLDRTRQRYTIKEILRIAREAKHVIVLSHNEVFLLDLKEACKEPDIQELEIDRGPEGSQLSSFDVEEKAMKRYVFHIQRIREFVDGTSDDPLEDIAGSLRETLEDLIYMKFPRRFSEDTILPDMINAIKDADDEDDLSRLQDHVEELEEVSDYSGDFVHGEGYGGTGTTTDAELQRSRF